jgi:uncharacterized Tic20 family protein
MTDLNSLTPTQDERVMASLSHVSALLPMMGVIAPIVIWVTQREKSEYVAFQALQALVYQLVMIAAWIIGWGFYLCASFGMIAFMPFVASSGSSQSLDPFFLITLIIPFLVLGAIFLGGFVFIVYGVVGAAMAFQGKPFRYILIGSRIERFIQKDKLPVVNR